MASISLIRRVEGRLGISEILIQAWWIGVRAISHTIRAIEGRGVLLTWEVGTLHHGMLIGSCMSLVTMLWSLLRHC